MIPTSVSPKEFETLALFAISSDARALQQRGASKVQLRAAQRLWHHLV